MGVDKFRSALNEPILNGKQAQLDVDPATGEVKGVTWNDPIPFTLGDNPNVIEAEILRRFAESVPPNGKIGRNAFREPA